MKIHLVLLPDAHNDFPDMCAAYDEESQYQATFGAWDNSDVQKTAHEFMLAVNAYPDLLELVKQYEKLAEGLISRPSMTQPEFETLKSALKFTAPQRQAAIAAAKEG